MMYHLHWRMDLNRFSRKFCAAFHPIANKEQSSFALIECVRIYCVIWKYHVYTTNFTFTFTAVYIHHCLLFATRRVYSKGRGTDEKNCHENICIFVLWYYREIQVIYTWCTHTHTACAKAKPIPFEKSARCWWKSYETSIVSSLRNGATGYAATWCVLFGQQTFWIEKAHRQQQHTKKCMWTINSTTQ